MEAEWDIPGFGLEDLAVECLGYPKDDPVPIRHIDYIYVGSTPYIAWRTRANHLIRIDEMNTSHIINCIKMIHRSGDTWRKHYLQYLELELNKRRRLLPHYLA